LKLQDVSVCLVSLCLVSLCVACGPPPVPQPPAFAPVTAQIPGDTPYVIVVKPLQLSTGELQDELKALARESGLARLVRGRVLELFGVDLLDADVLARTGLDPRGDFALFSLAGRPAALIRVADATAFAAFMEAMRTRDSRLEFGAQGVKGREVETVMLGGLRLSYVLREGYLVAVLHTADPEQSSRALEALVEESAPDEALGASDRFREALETLDVGASSLDVGASSLDVGASSLDTSKEQWDTVLFVQTEALEASLLERADPERDPNLARVPEAVRPAVLEAAKEKLERCAESGANLVENVPYIIGGMKSGAGRTSQRLLVVMSPELKAVLSEIFGPVGGRYPALKEGAIAAAALSINFTALASQSSEGGELVTCPDLATLEGVARLLVRGFGNTDAPYVFSGPFYGALYGFDLNFPWVSARSGLLVFEVLDMEGALRGFDLYFRAIGMNSGDTDDDGSQHYSFMYDMLSLTLVPKGDALVVLLGTIEADKVDQMLASRVEGLEEVALLDVNAEKLHFSLEQTITQLAMTGLHIDAVFGVIDALQKMENLQWAARFTADGLSIDGHWSTPGPPKSAVDAALGN